MTDVTASPTADTHITVHILDKAYPLRCREQEAESLQQAALWVDAKMREMRELHNMTQTESAALLVALQIAHESMLSQQHMDQATAHAKERLALLQQKMVEALTQQEQISL